MRVAFNSKFPTVARDNGASRPDTYFPKSMSDPPMQLPPGWTAEWYEEIISEIYVEEINRFV